MIDQELKDFVNEIVGKAMARDDRSVSVNFSDSEVYISIYPVRVLPSPEAPEHEPEKVEVYEGTPT